MPQVREVGANAVRPGLCHLGAQPRGGSLEDTPAGQADALTPTLTRLFLALYSVPAGPDAPVAWHRAGPHAGSWREFLLRGPADDPGNLVHGWSAALAGDRELAALSVAAAGRVRALAEACRERRNLVHGDLLHGNVLVSPDARRVQAVRSWKCSVRGDFLFDAAWCSFWAPFHPGSPPPIRCPGCSGPRPCGPGPARCSTPPSATTATSCTSATPTWDETSGPAARPASPPQPGVSPRSSSAAPCLSLALKAAPDRRLPRPRIELNAWRTDVAHASGGVQEMMGQPVTLLDGLSDVDRDTRFYGSFVTASDLRGHVSVRGLARIFFRRRNLQVFTSDAGAATVSVLLIDPRLTSGRRRARLAWPPAWSSRSGPRIGRDSGLSGEP